MTLPLDAAAVASYLAGNPLFFQDQAELLASIRLPSALGGRTLSLQERQMDVLREKVKAHELQLATLMRIGQENDALADKFQAWTHSLLLARNDVDLPHVLVDRLRTVFDVPQATLRMWDVAPDFAHTWFAAPVSHDARLFTSGLSKPFCGANDEFEAGTWLEEGAAVKAIAMLPLRQEGKPEAFGLLVLGSPDAERFTAAMGTDFLSRIAATGSAALTCLLA